ncbi:GTP-binding protein [bacterium]|nr:MAG: GTP-binding protein [bacterium]
MSKPLLPIVLVTGFLGAGKTTFLRHLLLQAKEHGLKAGVVINEWGVANVDGAILESSGAQMLGELAGGCACCSSQDEMIWTMLELGQLPREQQPDFVVLELSGMADPLVALDGLTVAALLPLTRVASMVSLVEAALVPELNSRSDRASALWTRQIALADQVIVNKTDQFLRGDNIESGKATLERLVREINERGSIFFAKGGAIDLSPIWERIGGDDALEAPNAGKAAHDDAQTLVLPLSRPIPREQLEAAFLNMDEGVWRAKGFLKVEGESGLFLAQYVGVGKTQFSLEEFEPRYLNAVPPTEMVFIGPNLDKNALLVALTGQRSLV